MDVVLEGSQIKCEADFHKMIASKLDLGAHYGRNLDALWDVLTGDVERPVRLIWQDSAFSKSAMPAAFDRIVDVMSRVASRDVECGWDERFEFKLV